MQTSQSRTGALLVGVLLIVFGIGALAVRQLDLDLAWPAWVIVPGLILFLAAFALPVPAGAGLAAAGSIVTTVGAVLAFQRATDAYSTWSYAWALVAPGGVGLGLFLYGLVTRRREIAQGGFSAMVTGIVLFLVFFAFFEGVIRLNEGRFGEVSTVIVPGALVVLGVIVLLGAFIPGPWRAPARSDRGSAGTWWTNPGSPAPGAGWRTGPDTGAPAGGAWPMPGGPSTAVGGSAVAASLVPDASGTAAADGAPTGAGAAATGAAGAAEGSTAAASIGSAGPTASSGAGPDTGAGQAASPGTGTNETVDLPLAGATDAEVRLAFGAGRLFVGAAQPGRLAEGTCTGGVEIASPAPGRVRLSAPSPSWNWTRIPFEWRLGLTAEVPLRLEVETGASDAELDLTLLRVTDLRLRVGAAQARVTLPAAAGLTRVDAEGGAAQLRFRVPQGVSARIRSAMALGSTDIDTARFPAAGDGRTWASPDFETATHRVEIEIRGGAGAVTIV